MFEFIATALAFIALIALVTFVAVCAVQAIVEDIRDLPNQRERNRQVHEHIARINARQLNNF